MSRVSKIPRRHSSHRQPEILSILAKKCCHRPAGVTTPEQADENRTAYRAKCQVRRNGAGIERLDENGQWVLDKAYKSIAQAKAATTSRRYTV